ncbi:glycosyltransferase family 10 domain-containing protein [Niveispirillum sp. KHB5.9]|uniref:glycosyltransferase family 10 domain-containing protein n=1 Tax=Niveispirillum sp. KHB5.9 TaxID=3400269 RepID=UPI003A8AE3CF
MLAETFGIEWMRISLPFACEIHWCRPRRMEENGNYKVLMLHTEPAESLISVEELRPIYHFFDLIIAADPAYGTFPNCVIRQFGSLWATKLPRAKEFSASFLFSMGALRPTRPGYGERLAFMNSLPRAGAVPLRIYKGRMFTGRDDIGFPLLPQDSKNILFESMFHIAVENAFDRNYFTEKLLDCLATYTVPIYMGCPNIGDFFDTDGMILVPPGGSIIDAVNGLTLADYWKRMASVAENARRSRRYADYQAVLRKTIFDASGY